MGEKKQLCVGKMEVAFTIFECSYDSNEKKIWYYFKSASFSMYGASCHPKLVKFVAAPLSC